MAEKKKKVKGGLIAEIIIYSVMGLMALWGLIYIAFGITVNFVGPKNFLYETNKRWATHGLGFLPQGLIILAVAIVVIVITLLVAAKSSDKEFEKEQRRILARQNRRKGNQTVEDAEVEEVAAAE